MNRLSAAIGDAGGKLGYDILVHTNFQRSTKETYDFLNGGLADGLVLFGPSADEPLLPLLRDSNLPTVIIGPRRDDTSLATVLDDEVLGVRMIADALVENGHQVIAAIVEAPGGNLDPTGRLRRLQAELAARGVTMDSQNVFVWRDTPEDTLKQLLALEPRPTAVFVWHDRTAYRVVETCESMGLNIPGDLSIIGYDGLVWPSTSGHIVTSVLVPLDEMAEAGVSLLHRMIEGANGPVSITLPVQFLPGTTIGPRSVH